MAERLNYAKVFPEGVHAVLAVDKAIKAGGLEPSLLELVKSGSPIHVQFLRACMVAFS